MKQKRKATLSKEEYISMFCREKRIRDREVLYVSKEVHDRLKDIAFIFKFDHYTTLSSLVDTILGHHTEEHKELFNRLSREFREEFLEELSSSKREAATIVETEEDNEDKSGNREDKEPD